MIKQWEIIAEVNMDASKIVSCNVKANTERKACIIGKEKLSKEGYFYIFIKEVKEIKEDK